MAENKVPGIWKWSLLLLILCNIGLIITLWLKPGMGGHPPHPESPRDYVIRNLKFTDEQVKKYDALIQVHHTAMEQHKKDAREYRRLLFDNLKNGSAGLNTDSLAQLIANNQKEIEVITYAHFAQVKTICTDAQKVEFDKIIDDVTKKMNGGMHQGPPPHDGDGHGPPHGPHDEDDHNHPGDEQGPPPGSEQNP